jgi:hypothetical protein
MSLVYEAKLKCDQCGIVSEETISHPELFGSIAYSQHGELKPPKGWVFGEKLHPPIARHYCSNKCKAKAERYG